MTSACTCRPSSPPSPTRPASPSSSACSAEGERTAGDIAEPFAMSKPAISKHLKVLEDAGLIERRVDRQWRIVPRRGRRRSAPSTTGSSATARSGRRRSTASTSCSPTTRSEETTMADDHDEHRDRGPPTAARPNAPWSSSASSRRRRSACSRRGPIPRSWPSGGGRKASPLPTRSDGRPRRRRSGAAPMVGAEGRSPRRLGRLSRDRAAEAAGDDLGLGAGDGKRGHETVVELTFEPAPGGTRMRLVQSVFENAEQRDMHTPGLDVELQRPRAAVRVGPGKTS